MFQRKPETERAAFVRPTPEYPDQDQLSAYGALAFLYMRADKYKRIAFEDMRSLIQPPIDLRFYQTLNIEGVPRAAITWAFLSAAAEVKLTKGEMITPADWASGTQAWIMEVIAPYKQGNLGAKLTRSMLAAIPQVHKTVRFARFASPGKLQHVTEYRRGKAERWNSVRIPAADFQNELKVKGA